MLIEIWDEFVSGKSGEFLKIKLKNLIKLNLIKLWEN